MTGHCIPILGALYGHYLHRCYRRPLLSVWARPGRATPYYKVSYGLKKSWLLYFFVGQLFRMCGLEDEEDKIQYSL